MTYDIKFSHVVAALLGSINSWGGGLEMSCGRT